MRFQSHYIDRGIKCWDLYMSIVERYLIQCPFLGVCWVMKPQEVCYFILCNLCPFFMWRLLQLPLSLRSSKQPLPHINYLPHHIQSCNYPRAQASRVM